MADTTPFGLTQETALNADDRFPLQQTSAATRVTSATLALMGGLEIVHRDTDADFTMVAGEHYICDISAWSNSGSGRTWTLPAAANVGERIAVTLETGDDTEHLALTAATSDTLAGVAGGTEWSRLFITNETVVMKCVTADSQWIIEHDGRKPQMAAYDGGTISIPDNASTGVDLSALTEAFNIGPIADTTNDYFTPRRAGKYYVAGSVYIRANIDSGAWVLTEMSTWNGSTWDSQSGFQMISSNSTNELTGVTNSRLVTLAAAGRVRVTAKHTNGTTITNADASAQIYEVLSHGG